MPHRHFKTSPILMGLVLMLITYVLNSLSLKLTGIQVDPTEYQNALMNGTIAEYAQSIFRLSSGAAAVILDAAIRIMRCSCSAGFTMVRSGIYNTATATCLTASEYSSCWLFILDICSSFFGPLLLGCLNNRRVQIPHGALSHADNPEISAMQYIRKQRK